jgi:predicted nucleic acid-binding protein
VSVDRLPFGLLDTSVFIGIERGRPVRSEALPQRSAASIISVGELRAGILAAPDIETRDRRLVTFEAISGMAILPIDDSVARVWAGMRAYLAASSRGARVNDMWIAATAAAHEMPVVTQDHDFYALSGVNGLTVVEV